MSRTMVASIVFLALAGFIRADVVLQKTPDRGIQPQAVVDAISRAIRRQAI
jgi:hypothetical protein